MLHLTDMFANLPIILPNLFALRPNVFVIMPYLSVIVAILLEWYGDMLIRG